MRIYRIVTEDTTKKMAQSDMFFFLLVLNLDLDFKCWKEKDNFFSSNKQMFKFTYDIKKERLYSLFRQSITQDWIKKKKL